MSRMHWWIMAVGAVFFLWFFIPAFVVVNIGNITGMAVSALVLLYGIFTGRYRMWQETLADARWQAGLSALGMVLLFILLIVTVETAGMIRSAANRAPENTTAVVLGCSVKGEPSRVLSERLCAAYEYLNRNQSCVRIIWRTGRWRGDQRGRVHVPLPDRAGDRRGETASGGPVHDDGGKSAIFHGIVTTARNRRVRHDYNQ